MHGCSTQAHEASSPPALRAALVRFSQRLLCPEATVSADRRPPLPQRKDEEGRLYYTFEFTSATSRATRHAISTIAIANGKAFTLTAGSSEKRWGKMKDKLNLICDSFVLFGY